MGILSKQKKKNQPLIASTMNLGKLAQDYPGVAQFLQESYGLHCIGCHANAFDTLETGLKVHGYTEDDVATIIEEANVVATIDYD